MIIKEECEDFLVDEIPNENFYQEESAQFHVYKLIKRNYTTERAVTHIAKALHIPRKYISFSGTKDKKAITTQYITISGAKKERVLSLELKDLHLEFIGYRKERLALGLLQGNKFSLLVKNVSMPKQFLEEFYVPNYFDEQRFSSHNTILGRLILKKQYKEAVDIIIEHDADYKEVCLEHLQKQTNDYIGALRLLPRRTLLFYVHAVQSYLFNQQLKDVIPLPRKIVTYSEGEFNFPQELLSEVKQEEGELIGFESQNGYEDIEPYDFINKSFPELSLSGGKRLLYSKVSNCKLEEKENGIHVEFSLGKGSYATIVLKQLFG
jgi:tRNA pseudouridine13 synthase